MLSQADKERVYYHLSYSALSLPTELSLGDPTAVTQQRWILDRHLLEFRESAEPLLIRTLDRLDCIERDMDKVRSAIVVRKSGQTEFRDDAIDLLEIQYKRFVRRLADQLSAQVNPVSNEVQGQSGGVREGSWF